MRKKSIVSSISAMVTLSIASGVMASPSMASPSPVQNASVTVDPSTVLSKLSSTPWGINARAMDADLQDDNLYKLLLHAGIRTIRFPGGSLADAYHWKDNSITAGAGFTTFPGANFDQLMTVAKAAKSQPIITVNYGSNADGTGGGSPSEAAAWVKYANVTRKYGVKYWEIGNENYGDWEVNLHKVNSATQYGTDALQYIKAMKSVDPTIQVGLVLANPGSSGNDPNWNDTVLSIAGKAADFVIIHWYPFYQTATEQQVLDAPSSIPSVVAGIKQQIQQDCGANASHLKIMVTETNSYSGGPYPVMTSMTNAQFLADDFTTFLEQGVANVDWWDLYNDGSPSTGDFGVLQDTSNTPYPTYYALEMLNLFAKPGNDLIGTTSGSSTLKVHAVKKGNGNLSILLINENPTQSSHVSIRIAGYKAASIAQTYTYGVGKPYQILRGSASAQDGRVQATLAPNSMTVIALTQSH